MQPTGTSLGTHAASRHRTVRNEVGLGQLFAEIGHLSDPRLHAGHVAGVEFDNQIAAITAVHAVGQTSSHGRSWIDHALVQRGTDDLAGDGETQLHRDAGDLIQTSGQDAGHRGDLIAGFAEQVPQLLLVRLATQVLRLEI